MRTSVGLLIAVVLCFSLPLQAGDRICVNQVGYTALEEKIAVVEQAAISPSYRIVDEQGRTVWRGKACAHTTSPFSGKKRATVDFSSLTKPGNYTLIAGKYRQPIRIAEHPIDEVYEAALHAFYLQRCQHPDTCVLIHPSAAGPLRKAGDTIASPGGWYDAGDYNKYIVNSAFSHGILFAAYEAVEKQEKGTVRAKKFLSENLHNLRWMLTMQDPDDGGVYHKLTTPRFEEHIQPVDCRQTRYVVQKSTQAALDFAAAMAMAARVYRHTPDSACHAFADSALLAAEQAFAWAVRHPNEYYDQPGNNLRFDPDCTTGMYDDTNAHDEFLWAATELYLTTRQPLYNAIARQFLPDTFLLPVWGDVATLATYSLINHAQPFTLTPPLSALVHYCQQAVQGIDTTSFHSPHGNRASDFCWGSNGEKGAGQAIALLFGYALTGDEAMRKGAWANMDYLLGRNATGYCFVTGMGHLSPMNPHHRLSDSDGIENPLPGFLVGGPNIGKQDQSEEDMPAYPEVADECYLDVQPSYATNEVAINWNAYLLALTMLLSDSASR
ncbi:MAG: glycoside hydrolase family 9 protein [Paludibacteraceae bacterium]